MTEALTVTTERTTVRALVTITITIGRRPTAGPERLLAA
jgi:hypothetical protein